MRPMRRLTLLIALLLTVLGAVSWHTRQPPPVYADCRARTREVSHTLAAESRLHDGITAFDLIDQCYPDPIDQQAVLNAGWKAALANANGASNLSALANREPGDEWSLTAL